MTQHLVLKKSIMGKMTKTWNYYVVRVSANEFCHQIIESFT